MDDRYIVEKALLESKYYKINKDSNLNIRIPLGLRELYKQYFGKSVSDRIMAMMIDDIAKARALQNNLTNK